MNLINKNIKVNSEEYYERLRVAIKNKNTTEIKFLKELKIKYIQEKKNVHIDFHYD